MNRVVTSRVARLMAAAIVVVIGACSDANGSNPGLTGPNPSLAGGSTGDTGKTPPGNPGGGHSDTSVTPPKPNPKPVASFTLDVHVASVHPGSTDTLGTDPVAGAAVSVYEETFTFTPHPGADTVNINQTLVGSGLSDANGDFGVPNLKGTGQYLIKVAGPTGSNFGPATASITQAYVDPVKVLVTLHGR
jgi:hypothetical protein